MSKKFKNIPLLDEPTISKIFTNACVEGDLSTIKYILTSKKLFVRPHSFHLNEGLTNAALNGHLNIVEYLMYSEDLETNPNFNNYNYSNLQHMCQHKHFDVVDFLFKNNIFEPQRVFIEFHKNIEEPTELSHYLIEKCNVPINISIQSIIDRNPLISKIFIHRDLESDLKNNTADKPIKKHKL